MSRSDKRHQEKLSIRSLFARRSEKVDELRRRRDLEMKQLWDGWQRRIDAARRAGS